MIAEIFGEQGLIVLGLIVILLFGGSKLPELAKSLGRAKREFSEGLDEGKEPDPEQKDAEPADSTPPADSTAPKPESDQPTL